ncbi:hypothetical protein U1Q18_038078 [Sarracenia purpurea var. burkii]
MKLIKEKKVMKMKKRRYAAEGYNKGHEETQHLEGSSLSECNFWEVVQILGSLGSEILASQANDSGELLGRFWGNLGSFKGVIVHVLGRSLCRKCHVLSCAAVFFLSWTCFTIMAFVFFAVRASFRHNFGAFGGGFGEFSQNWSRYGGVLLQIGLELEIFAVIGVVVCRVWGVSAVQKFMVAPGWLIFADGCAVVYGRLGMVLVDGTSLCRKYAEFVCTWKFAASL